MDERRMSGFPTILLILLTGCGTLPDYDGGFRDDTYGETVRTPALDFASITSVPSKRGVYREIDRLGHLRGDPRARLRLAFLLGEVARHDEAMTELNGVLFGDVDHGPSVEAFARYLRAEAFARRGDVERATADRREALAIAIDPALRGRLTTLVEAADASARGVDLRNLRILPRSSWDARRARSDSMDPMGRVYRVTIHHSAILTRDRGLPAASASIQAIQRSHQDKNGWSDIGYHYLIDAAGRIWEGRESRWQGAHAGNQKKNRGNIGVCMLGNFIDGGQRPSQAQSAALAQLVRWLQRRHGFQDDAIFTHNEFKVTECPGRHLRDLVDRLRGSRTAAASR